MRVLVLGGTGAMGNHVCRMLAEGGHNIVVTTRRSIDDRGGVHYEHGDAKDKAFLDALASEGWDAIVDFMVWSTDEFKQRYGHLLDNTKQYVFLSSYRVYANSPVITEDAPRLLDVIDDEDYLSTDEYALSKARCEDMLTSCEHRNWTIVRPAITYDGSVGRLQLTVFEAKDWLWRAQNNIPVPLPKEMLEKQATMTWGGDVARMIARLVGNQVALGETFIVSTSDHMTWSDVAKIYQEIVPLRIKECDLERFEKARGGIYQIRYDRMFDRVIDNSKVLCATNMHQKDLISMRDGLTRELELILRGHMDFKPAIRLNARLDGLTGGIPSFASLISNSPSFTPIVATKYLVRRMIK